MKAKPKFLDVDNIVQDKVFECFNWKLVVLDNLKLLKLSHDIRVSLFD